MTRSRVINFWKLHFLVAASDAEFQRESTVTQFLRRTLARAPPTPGMFSIG